MEGQPQTRHRPRPLAGSASPHQVLGRHVTLGPVGCANVLPGVALASDRLPNDLHRSPVHPCPDLVIHARRSAQEDSLPIGVADTKMCCRGGGGGRWSGCCRFRHGAVGWRLRRRDRRRGCRRGGRGRGRGLLRNAQRWSGRPALGEASSLGPGRRRLHQLRGRGRPGSGCDGGATG